MAGPGSVSARAEGPLDEMSERDLKQWARHVRDGHVPFHKRCRTCVMNAGSGRQHRRVLNPSSYVLSVDVAGPFRSRGIDADGKYRYALVGSYCMPKLPSYKEPDLEPQSPSTSGLTQTERGNSSPPRCASGSAKRGSGLPRRVNHRNLSRTGGPKRP